MFNLPVVKQPKPVVAAIQDVCQDNAPRRISVNPVEERITSVIGGRSRLVGDQLYEEGVKIDGEIEGTVRFGTDDGLCILSKTGVINGTLIGPRAMIMGSVHGDVYIDGLLLLAPGSVIDGNITYGRLVVYDGAQIHGTMRCSLQQREAEAPALPPTPPARVADPRENSRVAPVSDASALVYRLRHGAASA